MAKDQVSETQDEEFDPAVFKSLTSRFSKRAGKSDLMTRVIKLNPAFAREYDALVAAGKAKSMPNQLGQIIDYVTDNGGSMLVQDLGTNIGVFSDGTPFVTQSGSKSDQSPAEVLKHYRGNKVWSWVVCGLTGLPKPESK